VIKFAFVLKDSTDPNNPNVVQLYQRLADIVSIFWEFHKTRVESGQIPKVLLDTFLETPFVAQAELDLGRDVLDTRIFMEIIPKIKSIST
jgi:hypothetical protein